MTRFTLHMKRVRQPAEFGRMSAQLDALAETLMWRGDVVGLCHELGSVAAEEGLGLAELLDHLEQVIRRSGAGGPAFDAARAAAVAWSEASLRYQHGMACEDPLTGLSSIPHLRSVLAALYREAERADRSVADDYALVVVEIADRSPETDCFEHAFRLVEMAAAIREVYSGGEVLTGLTNRRVCALVPRDHAVGERRAVLASHLYRWSRRSPSAAGAPVQTRIWIEGLPAHSEAGVLLLDELAR